MIVALKGKGEVGQCADSMTAQPQISDLTLQTNLRTISRLRQHMEAPLLPSEIHKEQ